MRSSRRAQPATAAWQGGDRVLVGGARTPGDALPWTVVVARYGDAFGAALPDTRLDDAFRLAAELRRRVAALCIEDRPEVRLTCSIGAATFPGLNAGDAMAALVAAAVAQGWPAQVLTVEDRGQT